MTFLIFDKNHSDIKLYLSFRPKTCHKNSLIYFKDKIYNAFFRYLKSSKKGLKSPSHLAL